jgi:hypothetical protein
MTREHLEHRLHRWLDAERRGAEETAEEELAGLLTALPRPAPSPALALRVLACLEARPALPPWLGLERLAGGLLLATSSAILLFSWLATPLLHLLGGLEPGRVGIAATEVVRVLVDLVGLWGRVGQAGRWAQLLLASPEVQGSVALCLLLAATSARLLYHLLNERNPLHAEARASR